MARTEINPTQILPAGVNAPTETVGISDGHMVKNAGDIHFEVTNTNAVAQSVTFITPREIGGLAVADRVVSIPATSGLKKLGPFSPGIYNQPDGRIHINYDSTAPGDMGIRVYRI